MGLPLHHSATTTTTDRPTTLATNRRHRNWRTALAMQTTIHRLDIWFTCNDKNVVVVVVDVVVGGQTKHAHENTAQRRPGLMAPSVFCSQGVYPQCFFFFFFFFFLFVVCVCVATTTTTTTTIFFFFFFFFHTHTHWECLSLNCLEAHLRRRTTTTTATTITRSLMTSPCVCVCDNWRETNMAAHGEKRHHHQQSRDTHTHVTSRR